jgi:lysophospholipase L1-like esterase
MIQLLDKKKTITPRKKLALLQRNNSAWWLAGGINPLNAIAAFQPFGANSLAESYINLTSPGTHDAVMATSDPILIAGWKFLASGYLTTDIIPATGWSMICRYSNVLATGGCLAGEFKAGAYFDLYPNQSGGSVVYGSGGNLTVTPELLEGDLCIAGNKGYRNGVAESGTASAWTVSADHGIYIGCNDSNGAKANAIQASIQALAIYNTTLSAAQVLAVHNALAALCQINLTLYDGDSRTYGTGVTGRNTYPAQLSALFSNRNEELNYGVLGQTQVDMNADAATQVDTKYNPSGRRRNVVLAWGGHNDLYNSRSAADTYADISTYVTARKAVGFKVVVGTIVKSQQLTGPKETARQSLNTLILANTAGADGVADVGAAPELQNYDDTNYFTDKTHFTAAGNAAVAREFYTPLRNLLT